MVVEGCLFASQSASDLDVTDHPPPRRRNFLSLSAHGFGCLSAPRLQAAAIR